MHLNLNGYKMIYFLENLLREYCEEYSKIDDLSNAMKLKYSETAFANSEDPNEYHNLLKYSHLGELVDFIKSKNFKINKQNSLESVNISVLIKRRNDIMHSRSITHLEMEKISQSCDAISIALKDNNYNTKWNKFVSTDINEYRIPLVHMVYSLGKNFDKLIGRNKELIELKREVTRPTPVSIVGHGGLGKTALVLQLIEDFLYSPDIPFENIYFMSFKNSTFENGNIRRFEKAINNHSDIILRLAAFMEIDTKTFDFNEIENLVWEKMFSKKSLLILDNLETEIVKSNLNEFTDIAQRFIAEFSKPSRLIITSRYGLGDRESKLPLHQFNIENTKDLVKSYLSEAILEEKKIKQDDWDWIQSYTKGNPGLIIAFCNTLKSTRKKVMDLRVEYHTKYTEESKILHNQLEEFLVFCFENTIESMAIESQKFLAVLCYICSEANITEINEEFLTYLKDEVGLKALGEHNLRSQLFTNIGFLQPIPLSDKYYVNELFNNYLDGNFSENVFNVFKLKELEWYSEIEELKKHINEIQFDQEVSIGKLLSKLYLSKYRSENERKFLIQAFFCDPDLDKLIRIFNSSNKAELLNNFNLMNKVEMHLKSKTEKINQEKIISITIKSLIEINRMILSGNINKIRQRDLLGYYTQMENNIPILKNGNISLSIKKQACVFLNNFKEYKKVEFLIQDEPKLIKELFISYMKQVGDASGMDRKKCLENIEKCRAVIKQYPKDIPTKLIGQFKLYCSRYFKKENPLEALKLLNNFEEYYVSDDTNATIFYLESLLVRMECLISVKGDVNKIITLRDRFSKIFLGPQALMIFNTKRDKMQENFNKIEREIKKYLIIK